MNRLRGMNPRTATKEELLAPRLCPRGYWKPHRMLVPAASCGVLENNMTESETSSPIKFPCDFVIKVMGKANSQFEERVLNIVLRHFPDNDLHKVSKRSSRDNNYLALSVTVHPENQKQLDALYKDLSQIDDVLFTL